MSEPSSETGLVALRAELDRALALLNYPPRDWVPETRADDGTPVADVVIIGAGMNGLAAAFALRRLGLRRIVQVDAKPAGLAGPWLTYARMEYLRSPKHLTGPALGLPQLTFRAWWEAQFGPAGWDALGYISREDWARYLSWYAEVTGAKVQHETHVRGIEPNGTVVAVDLVGPKGENQIFARQVVLATGREGQAHPRIPEVFKPHIGRGVSHSSDPLDASALSDKTVVVIGHAASAFDNACVAAEAGATVTMLARAQALPRINKMKQTVYPGFAHGFPDLPDAERLGWLRYIYAQKITPPRHTVQRAARVGVNLVLGAETSEVTRHGDCLHLTTCKGVFEADHVILGTGFQFDFAAVPELTNIAGETLLWCDLAGVADTGDDLLDCPALGPGFELRPKPGVAENGLSRIRCFTHAAQASLGNLANDIPQASEGAERLARAVANALFQEDAAQHRAALEDYDDPELLGDEHPDM